MMVNNKKDLQDLYTKVQQKYLTLKSIKGSCRTLQKEAKIELNIDIFLSPHTLPQVHKVIGTRKISKLNNNQSMKKLSKEQQGDSYKEIANFKEEYKSNYVGRERQFYQKHQNNINALKFLKHSLFSQIHQTSPRDLTQFSSRKRNQNIFSRIKRLSQIVLSQLIYFKFAVFIFFGLLLLFYNVQQDQNEINLDQEILDGFRSRYPTESQKLYELQKEKYFLYEKLSRNKDQSFLQLFFQTKLNQRLSCLLGALLLLIGLIDYILSFISRDTIPIQIKPQPFLKDIKFKKQQQSNFQNNKNQQDQNNNGNGKSHLRNLSELYTEQKRKKEQEFLRMFNNQQDYLERRHREEEIKRDILEKKKEELNKELQQLNYQNIQEKWIQQQQRQKKNYPLTMGGYSIQVPRREESKVEQKKIYLNLNNKYINHKQISEQNDEDFDSASLAFTNSASLCIKLPKSSKILHTEKQKYHNIHQKSKTYSPISLSPIKTRGQSDAYKFCDRLF